MKPLFLCPRDVIKLSEDGQISSTQFLISKTPEAKLDEPQKFLLNCPSIPKGTVLEVSQLYIKDRTSPENSVTFKIVEGPMFSGYSKSMIQTEIAELQKSIDSLESKLKNYASSSPERTELVYNIKNRKKRIEALKNKKTKKGFIKLIRISLTDIESWDIKPSA